MGWRADEFWSSTMHELMTALEGWGLANGSKEARKLDEAERYLEWKAKEFGEE